MLMHARFIAPQYRDEISDYADAVIKTFKIINSFVESDKEWNLDAETVISSTTSLEQIIKSGRVLDYENQPMKDMGYTISTYLDLGDLGDIYATFFIGKTTRSLNDLCKIDIPRNFVCNNWKQFVDVFIELIELWVPTTSDFAHYQSLLVISKELADKVPVGYICFSNQMNKPDLPDYASSRKVLNGHLAYLKSPRFDGSPEESQQLKAIVEACELANKE